MATAPNALDAIMSEAETAAANFTPPVPIPVQVPVAANNNQALAKPSMDNFLDGGGMDVDQYFRVKPDGIRIGDDMKGLVDEIIGEIDMTEVTPIYSSRHESGGNTKFVKSYDGATTPSGENFQQLVAQLTATNQKNSGIYQTVEIPVTLVNDVADPKTKLVFEAGTRVGLTPSVTGFKSYQSFAKKLRTQDPSLLSQTLVVKLTHRQRKNNAGNEWGVVDFELAA